MGVLEVFGGLGVRVQGLVFRGLKCFSTLLRLFLVGFRVWGSGFRVQGFGF